MGVCFGCIGFGARRAGGEPPRGPGSRRGSLGMRRMLMIGAVLLASATLHGGQARQQAAPRSAGPASTAPQQAGVKPGRPVPTASSHVQGSTMAVATQRELTDQYCVTCHNSRAKTGGIALDAVDLANVGPHAE